MNRYHNMTSGHRKYLLDDKTVIRDFASHLQGTAGSFVFSPLTFQAFGGTATGN
ncbi:MAG: hypothetical protein P8130_00265 [Deltaproteobacteria bacterium]